MVENSSPKNLILEDDFNSFKNEIKNELRKISKSLQNAKNMMNSA